MKVKPRIAIIDSGLDYNVEFVEDVVQGVSFYIENQSLYIDDTFNDECGHGTQCASVIKKYCPNALLYIVKIINKTKKCSSVLLLQALEYLTHIDVMLINISLSISSLMYEKEIASAIKALTIQGKVVNIAVKNGQAISFPASVPECFGILGGDVGYKLYDYCDKQPIQICVNNNPEWVLSLGGKYRWFGGNSKATACMTGIMAAWIREFHLDDFSSEIKYLLMEKQDEIVMKNIDIISEKHDLNQKAQILFEKVKEILDLYIDADTVDLDMLLWDNNTIKIIDTFSFLKDLERLLNIKLSIDQIKIQNCIDVRHIMYWILQHESDKNNLLINKEKQHENSSKNK